MKYYAVIDTNVLVSAMLKWQSVPGKILELAFSGLIIPLFNDEILSEYKIVLSRPKFKLSNELVNSIVNEIEEKGLYVNEKHWMNIFLTLKTGYFMRLLWKNETMKMLILLQEI